MILSKRFQTLFPQQTNHYLILNIGTKQSLYYSPHPPLPAIVFVLCLTACWGRENIYQTKKLKILWLLFKQRSFFMHSKSKGGDIKYMKFPATRILKASNNITLAITLSRSYIYIHFVGFCVLQKSDFFV